MTDARPRLGFLGLGWIGRHRLQSLVDAGACQVVALADSHPASLDQAHAIAPDAQRCDSLDALLSHALDGLVIATPSALHAPQCLRALDQGLAVFCQKPLARTEAEARNVIDAARRADRLLGCDLSYRHTEGMQRIRQDIADGLLGSIHAVDLVFHNAWGPDKGWAHDLALSGGGCAIDLGTHLIDLALWTLGHPAVTRVDGQLYANGHRLPPRAPVVEDFAFATLQLDSGATVRLACSWNVSTGRDAVIEAHVHGSAGGAALRNVDGSFFDFSAERFHGNRRIPLAGPPDAWGGRAVLDWARRLGGGSGYTPEIESLLPVARALDALYGRTDGC